MKLITLRRAIVAAAVSVAAGGFVLASVGDAADSARPEPKLPPIDLEAEYPVMGPDGQLQRNPDGSVKTEKANPAPPVPPGR